MKLLLRIVLPILVLALGFAAKNYLIATGPVLAAQEAEFLIPVVEIVTAKTETTTLDLIAYGEVRPRATSSLVAEVAAKVIFVSDKLYRGAFFEQGEELLRLDHTDFALAVSLRKASLEQALAGLKLEQAQATVAAQEWESLGAGEASAVVLRKPQLAAAKAKVKTAEANIALALNNLKRTTIVAPFAGRTQMRNVEVGNWVTPGSPLATVYAIDAAEVSLPLAASSLNKLGLSLAGPTTKIVVDFEAALGDDVGHWQGTLVRMDAALDPTTRMVDAIVLLEDPFRASAEVPALAPGMFLRAVIHGRQVEGVVRIPRHALLDGSVVHVLTTDSHAEIRAVVVLQNTVTESLIASGLEDGDRVITTNLPVFVDGMQVRLAGENR